MIKSFEVGRSTFNNLGYTFLWQPIIYRTTKKEAFVLYLFALVITGMFIPSLALERTLGFLHILKTS